MASGAVRAGMANGTAGVWSRSVSAAAGALAPNRRNLQGYLFSLPLILLFLAFVVYPLYFVVTQAVDPYTYEVLFSDPIFVQTIVNTVVYVGIAVNLKLFLALLLSGLLQADSAARGSSRRSSSCRGRFPSCPASCRSAGCSRPSGES